MTRTQFLVEVELYDPGVPGIVTKYYSTAGHVTSPSETPASQYFDPRVKQALQVHRTMFAPSTTRGRSTVDVGEIVLVNGDGELDAFTTYGVDGRTVTVRRGAMGAAYPSGFATLFVGTMQGVEVTQDEVRLKVRSRLSELSVPLQTTKYTGGGLGTLRRAAQRVGPVVLRQQPEARRQASLAAVRAVLGARPGSLHGAPRMIAGTRKRPAFRRAALGCQRAAFSTFPSREDAIAPALLHHFQQRAGKVFQLRHAHSPAFDLQICLAVAP